MARAYLLKTTAFEPSAARARFPGRAFPALAPSAGDLLFVWRNDIGLLGEARIVSCDETGADLGPFTAYGEALDARWLENADRDKTTIRSKIHCDRHDRLWRLSETETRELDLARRVPVQH